MALSLDEEVRSQDVTAGLYLLESGSAEDTIEAVVEADRQGLFRPLGASDVHLGYTNGTRWFRLSLQNHGPGAAILLELDNAQLGSVSFYRPTSSGGFESQAGGIAVPFGERSELTLAPTFHIRLEPGETQTCYLRVRHYGALRFNAIMRFEQDGRWHAVVVIALNILLAGALAGLAIYNGCVYLGLRQPAYAWLSLMLLALALNQMTFAGTASMLLWPGSALLANHGLTLTGVLALSLGIGFSRSFLNSRKNTPRLYWAAAAFIVLGTGCGLLSLAGYPKVFYGVLCYLLGTPALVGIMAIRAIRRGSVSVWMFLVSWGGLLIGELLYGFAYLGVLPDNAFNMNFVYVAALGASLLWSLTLTRQIKVRASRQRAILEQRVSERTAELEAALRDVRSLEGLLPVCSNCKKIRDEEGAWHALEAYVTKHTGADFSHGICPVCATALYPQYYPRKN